MEKITGPFKRREIHALNSWQSGKGFHPFTCCSHDNCIRLTKPNEGALIPTRHNLKCPCGKWKQNWCWDVMIGMKRKHKKKKGPFRSVLYKLKIRS